MNDTEKRRKNLLEQTRNLYQDDRINPAVHPRYKAAYHQLYPDEMVIHKGTFGVRCILCILAFGIYIMMGKNENYIAEIENFRVKETIMENYIEKLY